MATRGTPRSYGAGRDKTFTLRLSQPEKDRLLADAEAAGLDAGEYVRARVLGPEASANYLAAASPDATSQLAKQVADEVTARLSGLGEGIDTGRSLLGGSK